MQAFSVIQCNSYRAPERPATEPGCESSEVTSDQSPETNTSHQNMHCVCQSASQSTNCMVGTRQERERLIPNGKANVSEKVESELGLKEVACQRGPGRKTGPPVG